MYGLSGIFQVVASSNSAPDFADTTLTREIAENTAANVNIGDVIPVATDANNDDLVYSMEGADAASFNFKRNDAADHDKGRRHLQLRGNALILGDDQGRRPQRRHGHRRCDNQPH